jgi:glycine reductase
VKLELANFPVQKIEVGSKTKWQNGVLELNAAHIKKTVLEDPTIGRVEIEIASPGDSTRIINVRDVIEPKLKSEGNGVAYPGVFGRPTDTVGQGVTRRLSNVTVMGIARSGEITAHGSREWGGHDQAHLFVDMSGSGAISPYASLFNICVIMEPSAPRETDLWGRTVKAAIIRVSDYIAGSTSDEAPVDIETLDLSPKDGLPGLVYIPMLPSPEHRFGSNSSLGAAIYGLTRLTQPWLLEPTEMIDGAVFGTYGAHVTWPLTNSIVLDMCRRHGVDFNFLGCIVCRTNWESMEEKQLMANRAAHLASKIGADGALVTTNIRGQRFVETILTVQACEKADVKTVLITEEEDNEKGNAPPLLTTAPEVVSVISTGTGDAKGPFGSVERVIGAEDIDEKWYDDQPDVHGRYGVSHLNDVYGFSRFGRLDY